MVELQHISKTYRENGVRALSDVGFALKTGELHTVAGENGAGKSTLMHIMGGFIRPDSGKILVDGKPRHFRTSAAALRAGIGMVRQRPSLVEHFSVWENCALGSAMKDGGGFFFDRKKAREAAGALIEKLAFRLPLDMEAGRLSLSGQKKTAVLSLVMHGASFFIFDEPLAYLRREEKDEMLGLFLALRKEGRGVAVIAHEIREILPVSDRVTVLRNGRVVLSGEQNTLDETRVVGAMFGKNTDTASMAGISGISDISSIDSKKPEYGTLSDGESVLSVRNLCVRHPKVYPLLDVSMEVRRGEIAGIIGARESGIETLEQTLAGFIEPVSGSITVKAAPQAGAASAIRRQSGTAFAYIGLGGTSEAFALSLSVRDNLILHEHRNRTNPCGLLDTKALSDFAKSLVDKAGISVSVTAPASSLSGGMLARIIAERELAKNARVLLLSDPSAGLDIQALNTLLLKIRRFADSGGAALVFLGGVSPDEIDSLADTHEIAGICDRVYIIENGRARSGSDDTKAGENTRN